MPEYILKEIRQAREIAKRTLTAQSSTTEGTTDAFILAAANDAESTLQGLLLDHVPGITLFNRTVEIPLTGAFEYDLPGDRFAAGSVHKVEFSASGLAVDYVPVLEGHVSEMGQSEGPEPLLFDIFADKIRLTPTATSGKVKVTYAKAFNSLDIRRGSVTGTPANDGTYYTSIALGSDADSTALADLVEYVSICDRHGVLKYSGLDVQSYNSSTKTITLVPNTARMSAGTIAEGDYVVLGKYASSHSEFPANCDKFRRHYIALAIQLQTSNSDQIMQDGKIKEFIEIIIGDFQRTTRTVREVPILNSYWR